MVPQAELRDRIRQAAQRLGTGVPAGEPDLASWVLRAAAEQAQPALPDLAPGDAVTGQHLRLVLAYLLEHDPGWHRRLLGPVESADEIPAGNEIREHMVATVRRLGEVGEPYRRLFPSLIANFLDLPLQELGEDGPQSLLDGGADGSAAPYVIVQFGEHYLATVRRPGSPGRGPEVPGPGEAGGEGGAGPGVGPGAGRESPVAGGLAPGVGAGGVAGLPGGLAAGQRGGDGGEGDGGGGEALVQSLRSYWGGFRELRGRLAVRIEGDPAARGVWEGGGGPGLLSAFDELSLEAAGSGPSAGRRDRAAALYGALQELATQVGVEGGAVAGGAGLGGGVAHVVEEVEAALLDLAVDAVVVAGDGRLLGGAGVIGELLERGAGLLREELALIGSVGAGEAVVSTAPGAGADWLIHVAVPDLRQGEREAGLAALRAAYRAAVVLADELGLSTVAVPVPRAADPRSGRVPAGELRGVVREALGGTPTSVLETVYLVVDTAGEVAAPVSGPAGPAGNCRGGRAGGRAAEGPGRRSGSCGRTGCRAWLAGMCSISVPRSCAGIWPTRLASRWWTSRATVTVSSTPSSRSTGSRAGWLRWSAKVR